MASDPVRLVLASSSPRRIELLTRWKLAFRAVPPGIEERPPTPLGPLRYVAWAAAAKAEAVAARMPGTVVIGADTEVVLRGRIFGKPRDPEQATEFLRALSGRTHQVYSALQIIDGRVGCRAQGVSRTDVTMRDLDATTIAAYVGRGEAQDKAGAYAIQGEGRRLIASIRGPYDNVVGMPMRLLRRLLGECGIPVPANNPDELQPSFSNLVPPSSGRRPAVVRPARP
jgi:septum formation protein